MKSMVFMAKNCGVGWLCSGMYGYCEVLIVSAFAKLETVLIWDKSAKWIITTHGVGEGCKERLHCDNLKFGVTYGVETGVCFLEILYWGVEISIVSVWGIPKNFVWWSVL